jgi:hypothetical protein
MNHSLSEKESLQIIQEMVQSTRGNVNKSAAIYLLWGWLVVVSAAIHFALLTFSNFPHPYLAWIIFMPLGGIATGILSHKISQKEESPSYTSRMMSLTYSALIGPLLLAIAMGAFRDWSMAYPIFMTIYGYTSIIAGGILRFKPFQIGGIIAMLLGVASVFVDFNLQLIIIALAVLASYLIPGYMLKNQGK